MKKLKIGDIIKIPNKYHKELRDSMKKVHALQQTIEVLSESIQDENADFWRFIEKLYPATSNFYISYDRDANEIIIKGIKDEKN